MRKVFVYFFLLVYLFSSTELSELLKMNVLMSHFGEHTKKSNISFTDFIYIHYVNPHEDDGDNDENGKLPFQGQKDFNSMNYTVVIPSTHLPSISYIQTLENKEKQNFYGVHSMMNSSFLSSIWQPPQIV